MRRAVTAGCAAALLMILLAPAAHAGSARLVDRVPQRALGALLPARVITNGPLTVTGTVRTPAGDLAAGATVDWGYYSASGDWIYGNTTTTDAFGAFVFTGVIETASGTIDAYPAGSRDAWGLDPVTFASSAAPYDVAPGRVLFSNADQTGVRYSTVRVYTEGPLGYCRTVTTSQSGEAAAIPPSVSYATIRYCDSYNMPIGGDEWWDGTIPVTAGQLSPSPQIAVSEKAAHWMWIAKPFWGSGPPGSKVTLVLDNWAAPITASFYGEPSWPNAGTVDYSGTFYGTSTGEAGFVTLTVPKTAKPGYAYDFWAYRTDAIPVAVTGGHSRLEIAAGFEVCTLKATPAVVRPGVHVRLRGIVPTEGHQGTTAGMRKTLTVYVRTTKPAGQPATWNAAARGWKKAGTLRANGYGQYSGIAHGVRRTTWFIVRYPADNWFYGGYTAPAKVTVR